MHPRFLLAHFLLALVCLIPFVGNAQLTETFHPLPVSDGNEALLIKALRQQMRDQLATLPPKKTDEVWYTYVRNSESLIRRVRRGGVIRDPLLQGFVDSVFHDLIGHSHLKTKPKRALIAKLPYANASCMGEGTFMVTVGLLGRIENESQLAFTLAHEIAHYELGHVRERIIMQVATGYQKKATQGVKKILANYHDASQEEMDSLRKMMYAVSEFSRKQEMDADSLGLILQKNAGYNTGESLKMLAILDSVDYSKQRLGLHLFDDLQFDKYPFREEWLRPRPDYYYDKPNNIFIFSTDSIQSHPDIALRISKLSKALAPDYTPLNKRPKSHLTEVVEISQFEEVDLVFKARQRDHALLTALSLKHRYPRNSYLVSMISKILISFMDPEKRFVSSGAVPSIVSSQGEELRMVSTFLYNLNDKDAGELAFHFLNSHDNFNSKVPEHYFFMYVICLATERPNVAQKVKESFKDHFGGTKEYRLYIDKMRPPSPLTPMMDHLLVLYRLWSTIPGLSTYH